MYSLEHHTWHKAVHALVYIPAHLFILSIVWFLRPTWQLFSMTNFGMMLENFALYPRNYSQEVSIA